MIGRINVAEGPEFMVSRCPPNPVEKAKLAWIPRPNSPFENTPHKAGVEGEAEIVPATGAAVAVSAERGGAAAFDRPDDFELRPGDPGAAAFDKASGPGAENVSHFQEGRAHDVVDSRSAAMAAWR